MPNSLFAAILNIAADAIVSIDEKQNIVHYNQGAEIIFGWTAEEAVGRPLEMLIPERFRVVHKMHVSRFGASSDIARRMGHRREISGLRKNGEEFPAEASISKLDTENGRLYTVVLRDTSERKRIEEDQRLLANAGAALAKSLDTEDTFRTLVQLPVPHLADVCMLDTVEQKVDQNATDPLPARRIASVHNDPVINAHLRALENLGVPTLSNPSIISTALNGYETILMESINEEWIRENTTPERFKIAKELGISSVISVPLSARGHMLGVLTLTRLQGGHPYTAEDLRIVEGFASMAAFAIDNSLLYRNAQRANRTRDEILGIVSHDLQNPVSAIAMCAQALWDMPDGNDRSRRELALAISDATKWMKRMISDLLDVSSLEAGKLAIEFGKQDVQPIVQSATVMIEGQARERSINIKTEISSNLPQIHADAGRVGQSLANLMSNAIKFSPLGSIVTVRADNRDGEVVFSVHDKGIGIPEQNLPHIFNRYWQSRQSARRPGAGLGLAIVKGIAEAHGGRVWVESEVGKGSAFFFSIPAAK